MQIGQRVRITNWKRSDCGQSGVIVGESVKGGYYVRLDGATEPVYVPFGLERIDEPDQRESATHFQILPWLPICHCGANFATTKELMAHLKEAVAEHLERQSELQCVCKEWDAGRAKRLKCQGVTFACPVHGTVTLDFRCSCQNRE